MAYTLIYSGNQTGNREISVPDGSVASVGNIVLPGRNYSGYGQSVDQNMLSIDQQIDHSRYSFCPARLYFQR